MHALAQITGFIDDMMQSVRRKSSDCNSGKCSTAGVSLASLLKQLASLQLWPSQNRETQALEELVSTLCIFEWDAPDVECSWGNCEARPKAFSINLILNEQFRGLQSRIKAPCLSCVQDGSTGEESTCEHIDK